MLGWVRSGCRARPEIQSPLLWPWQGGLREAVGIRHRRHRFRWTQTRLLVASPVEIGAADGVDRYFESQPRLALSP